MKRLVECVPNFSEGRDLAVVEEIVRAIESVPGVVVLDREMDCDHNRSVITFVAPIEQAGEAAVRGVERASRLIDLNQHRGEHPRIGAADVVPFVPLSGVSIDDCVALAHRTGEEIWRRCGVPVYFYEAAARIPERANLENIRRGQFERLREEVKTNESRRPDVGGPELHPTAGATVVGARKFLIAYNINLATPDVGVAKRIAKKVRASSGGLPFVKAMGVEAKGQAQVSMNLTDFEHTPVHVVFEAVRQEAAQEGTTIESSEIIGLIPQKALDMAGAAFLKVESFQPGLVLENRLAELVQPSGLSEFLDQVAAPTAVPGGGSASAAAAALAAALGIMVAGLTARRTPGPELDRQLEQLRSAREFFEKAVWRDAAAYEAVREVYRIPKDQRRGPLEAALQGAAAVPQDVLQHVEAMVPLLQRLRELAPAAMHSDLDVADALAEAAARGARANVEINLAELQRIREG